MSTEQVAPTSRRSSRTQKDQAVRLVRQNLEETGERHGGVQRVARQLSFGVETLRKWVNQAKVDAGDRGIDSLKEWEREVIAAIPNLTRQVLEAIADDRFVVLRW